VKSAHRWPFDVRLASPPKRRLSCLPIPDSGLKTKKVGQQDLIGIHSMKALLEAFGNCTVGLGPNLECDNVHPL